MGRKRKASKCFKIPFKVIRETVDKGEHILKIIKPDPEKVVTRIEKYPIVYLKGEDAGNVHAFSIMHNLHHENLISMRALAKDKRKNSDIVPLVAFVEPYTGVLWSDHLEEDKCADSLNHIPSLKLQRVLREIVAGTDFLRQNGFYHGSLNWGSVLYVHPCKIKLAGFKCQDSMSLEEAQWNDWLCFIQMLEEIATRADQSNSSLPQKERYFCGNLNDLITMLQSLDQTALPIIKKAILDHPFLWDFGTTVDFFAKTVSLRLNDSNFREKVKKSSLRKAPWDGDSSADFMSLLDVMNEYRRENGMDPYDTHDLEHYVRCICGAYSHWTLIKLNVHAIIRYHHPSICLDMVKLLEA